VRLELSDSRSLSKAEASFTQSKRSAKSGSFGARASVWTA